MMFVDRIDGVDSKEVKRVFKELITAYMNPAYGSMSKRDFDILLFMKLQDLKIIEKDPDLYDIVSNLKVTRAKARNLLYEAKMRNSSEEMLDKELRELLSTPIFFKENDKIAIELPNTVYNTEGKIYIYEDKDKWDKRIHLVKRLYINSGPIFSNKLATVNSLVDYEGQIGIPEFVYPEKLLTVNREIVGFTMPYVPSTNLKEILTSSKTPAEVKIKYLKDIGTILEKMDEVRKYADLEDFLFK